MAPHRVSHRILTFLGVYQIRHSLWQSAVVAFDGQQRLLAGLIGGAGSFLSDGLRMISYWGPLAVTGGGERRSDGATPGPCPHPPLSPGKARGRSEEGPRKAQGMPGEGPGKARGKRGKGRGNKSLDRPKGQMGTKSLSRGPKKQRAIGPEPYSSSRSTCSI